MSGYLSHLVHRTLNLSPQVRPVLGTRFAPGPELLTDRAELPPELRQPVPPAREAPANRRQPALRAAQPAKVENAAPAPEMARAQAPLLQTADEIEPARSPRHQLAEVSISVAPERQLPEQKHSIPAQSSQEQTVQLDEIRSQFDKKEAQIVKRENQFDKRESNSIELEESARLKKPQIGGLEIDAVTAMDAPVGKEPGAVVNEAPFASRRAPELQHAAVFSSDANEVIPESREVPELQRAADSSAAAKSRQAATFLQRVQMTLSAMNAEVQAPELGTAMQTQAEPELAMQVPVRNQKQAPAEVPAQTQEPMQVWTQVPVQSQAQVKTQAQAQVKAETQVQAAAQERSEPPIIRVHISHLEVRGPAAEVPVAAAAPGIPAAAPVAGRSLSQYLEQRRKRS